MSMKTILLPTEQRGSMSAALETTLLMARRFDSYVEGFALRSRINDFVAMDVGGSFAMDSFAQESIEEAKKARVMFEIFHAGAWRSSFQPGGIGHFVRLVG